MAAALLGESEGFSPGVHASYRPSVAGHNDVCVLFIDNQIQTPSSCHELAALPSFPRTQRTLLPQRSALSAQGSPHTPDVVSAAREGQQARQACGHPPTGNPFVSEAARAPLQAACCLSFGFHPGSARRWVWARAPRPRDAVPGLPREGVTDDFHTL